MNKVTLSVEIDGIVSVTVAHDDSSPHSTAKLGHLLLRCLNDTSHVLPPDQLWESIVAGANEAIR